MSLFVFIAVFLSSTVGTSVFGVSLNKICLIPLIGYLLFVSISKSEKLKFPTHNKLICFYVLASISGAYALLDFGREKYEGYTSGLIFYVVQCLLMYIPLLILIYNFPKKEKLKDSFIKSLVLTTRIHMCFGALQLICYYVFSFDIGLYLSKDLLGNIFQYSAGRSWTCVYYDIYGQNIRLTGFNIDPNFFAVLMTIGFVLEKKKVMKFIFLILIMLCQTRSCIISAMVLLVIYGYRFFKTKKHLLRRICYFGSVCIMGLIFVVVMYFNNTVVKTQIDNLFVRFYFISGDSSSMSTSTERHIMYYPYGCEAYVTDLDIVEKFIGAGPRTSGTILEENEAICSDLNLSYLKQSWTLECDVMELLLSYGIVGLIIFYSMLYGLYKSEKEYSLLFVNIAVTGVMYSLSSLTIINLILIVFLATKKSQREMTQGEKYVQLNNSNTDIQAV